MAVTFKGGGSNTVAPVGSRLRVVWRWWLSNVTSPGFVVRFDAPRNAEIALKDLPAIGYTPVTLPGAAPGDEVVAYDVTVANGNTNKTLGQHAAALNAIGEKTYGSMSVDYLELVLIPVSTVPSLQGFKLVTPDGKEPTAQELKDGLARAKDEFNDKAQGSGLVDNAKDAAKKAWGEMKDMLGDIMIPVAVVAGVALLLVASKYVKGGK